MAERWYARLSQIFKHDLSSSQPLMLYASGPDFRQTNVVAGDWRRHGRRDRRTASVAS